MELSKLDKSHIELLKQLGRVKVMPLQVVLKHYRDHSGTQVPHLAQLEDHPESAPWKVLVENKLIETSGGHFIISSSAIKMLQDEFPKEFGKRKPPEEQK